MRYEETLVLRVNELFHDLEGADYGNKHEDIFVGEQENWQRVIPTVFVSGRSFRVLEVGVGTGFVATQVCPRLSTDSVYICTDISEKILAVAKKNLLGKYQCAIDFVKIDGQKYPFEDKSVDIVVLNSVLHHIPNIHTFFSEIKRILKTEGKIVIGHEPNKLFFTHSFLWYNYLFLSTILSPQRFIYNFSKQLGVVNLLRLLVGKKKKEKSQYQRMVDRINAILMSEGKIKNPLSEEDISAIIDIHSPTAGRNDLTRGIDIKDIVRCELPMFRIEKLLTYNYLHKQSRRNQFLTTYDKILGKMFPGRGATFFVVISGTGGLK